jgi:hypothetical protein
MAMPVLDVGKEMERDIHAGSESKIDCIVDANINAGHTAGVRAIPSGLPQASRYQSGVFIQMIVPRMQDRQTAA